MKFLPVFLLLLAAMPFPLHSQSDFTSELQYIQQQATDPIRYVVQKFSKYDIIFLGEDHAVKENLEFAAMLIPELYKAGVYNLGMEFGASEMQDRLDSLINSGEYNEEAARDMMYYYNVGWAYKEYMDIYLAAWKFNRLLKPSQKKFRIVNLSYRYDWSSFGGQRTPENMARVFMKGTPDAFRMRVVEEQVLSKHEKIVILTGAPHAFTRYKMPMLVFNSDNFCSFDDGWLGNRLYRKYPDRIFSILLHQPFHNKPNKQPWGLSPANGSMEKIMVLNKNQPCGFDLLNTPLGELSDSSFYATCYPDFTLEKLFDGYIFLKPFGELHGCTVDNLFFRNKAWEETSKQLPDTDWHGRAATQEEFWKQIVKYVNLKDRYKDLLE